MRSSALVPFLSIFSFLTLSLLGPVMADGGGIPIGLNVQFDESAQNAIVAWNGTVECLILSTDLQSPTPGKLLQMVPLPSAPYDVRQGNTSSFKDLIRIFNQKAERLDIVVPSKYAVLGAAGGKSEGQFEGIEILFSTVIGMHNITVVKLESRDHFIQWATDFANEHGASNLSIDDGLNASVGEYLLRGIQYFVFDVVDLTSEKRTAEPMVYLFNTTSLYYALKITHDTLSDAARRPNDISLFLVTDGVIRKDDSYFDGVNAMGGIDEYIEFSRSDLRSVSGPLAALFTRSAFVAHYSGRIYSRSYYHEKVSDIVLYPDNLRRPSASEMAAQYARVDFLRAIKPLSPSLGYDLLRGLYDPGYLPPAFWLAVILLGMFLAPVVLGFMYRGILERSRRNSALWIMWLLIYLVASAGILLFSLLELSITRMPSGFVLLLVALLTPVAVALLLGNVVRTRPSLNRRTLPALAYGMAAVQVAALVFTPSGIMPLLLAIICFPFTAVIGIILVAALAVQRYRKRAAS